MVILTITDPQFQIRVCVRVVRNPSCYYHIVIFFSFHLKSLFVSYLVDFYCNTKVLLILFLKNFSLLLSTICISCKKSNLDVCRIRNAHFFHCCIQIFFCFIIIIFCREWCIWISFSVCLVICRLHVWKYKSLCNVIYIIVNQLVVFCSVDCIVQSKSQVLVSKRSVF